MGFNNKFFIRKGQGKSRASNECRAYLRAEPNKLGWGSEWADGDTAHYWLDKTDPTRLCLKKNLDVSTLSEEDRKSCYHAMLKTQKGNGKNTPPYLFVTLTTSKWPFDLVFKKPFGFNHNKKVVGSNAYLPVKALVDGDTVIIDLEAVATSWDLPSAADAEAEPEAEPEATALAIVEQPAPKPGDKEDLRDFMLEVCRMANAMGLTLKVVGHNQLSAIAEVTTLDPVDDDDGN